VFERSPLIFLIGGGSFLTKVGMARIWSPRASLGFSKRSITSIWYLPVRRSSQICLRLANAARHLGVAVVRLVKTVVISLGFKTAIRRIRINLTSVVLSTEIKFANWGASLFCKLGVHKFLKFCNDTH
jgi:hypothetical protein